MTKSWLGVTTFFVAIKVCQIALVLLTKAQFDTSSQILLRTQYTDDETQFVALCEGVSIPPAVTQLVLTFLKRLVIWDSVYFTSLFVHGPKYEHEWVFGPLWWRAVAFVASKLPISNFYVNVLVASVTNTIFHYLTLVVLYGATALVFVNEKARSKVALSTCLLYVLNPAGIFLVAPYSESMAQFFSILGIYLRQLSVSQNRTSLFYVLSGVSVALGVMTRTNVLLVGYLYLYDFLCDLRRAKVNLGALFAGFVTFCSIVLVNWWPFQEFCPERGAWCDSVMPSMYQFAQEHYWNNGFLKYWTPNNVPNFLFATPVIVTSWRAIKHFSDTSHNPHVVPFVHLTFIFLFLAVTCWHVQIITRIQGFLPLMYWYLSIKLKQTGLRSKLKGKVFRTSRSVTFEKFIIVWFFVWIMVQTVLFAGFLPPA